MTKFFFHLRDGTDVVLDSDGIELASSDDVVAQALAEARSILGHDIREGRIDLSQRIEVLDEAGATVHVLQFADAVEIVGLPPPMPSP